ncbi:alpha/beta hydrolase family protein [Sphingobacterium paucimobilis]|nr:prolyl oligopeptidase family serine peptidase [Sphingobacterium paucimobilis]
MIFRRRTKWKTLTTRLTIITGLWLMSTVAVAQEQIPYKLPPKSIVDLVDAPQIPDIRISSDGTWMLMLEAPGFETIEQASQPVLGIAGLRINPITYTTVGENSGKYTSLRIRDIKAGKEFTLQGLPNDLQLTDIKWSPSNKSFAFLNKTMQRTELWIADLSTQKAQKVLDQVNDSFGNTFQWKNDDILLVQRIAFANQKVPQANPVPIGPIVQENLGGITPSRTYQNLLANAHDENLMGYYLSSDLIEIDRKGQTKELGVSGILNDVSYSPDGRYLLIEKIVRPYSYLVPIQLFPVEVSIVDLEHKTNRTIHTIPLGDNLPISFDAVISGPRNFSWHKDKEATLLWTVAKDGGDPNQHTEIRDELFAAPAPFEITQANKLYTSKYRIHKILWGSGFGIIEENWRKDRTSQLSVIDSKNNKILRILSNRKSEDTYTDPGTFLLNSKGKLRGDSKGNVYTKGTGASKEGDRPFVMRWNVHTTKQDTLYKSKRNYYEDPLFYDENGIVYVFRESSTVSPNVFAVALKSKAERRLTQFADPYPSLKNVEKKLLSYPRKDGLTLSATLYLPEGFKKGDAPLPVLIWAYPREFKTKAAAAQVKGSPHRYPRLAFRSPVFWVTRGYAVLDQADMPIVGEGSSEPNDTFIQQIEDNAKALIDHVVELGVADRQRIGVGGHSYGAFMTANLLAHTDLFAAGIARSGAYNRTLTPFGFQAEARTYWQAKDVYDKMSPFTYAPNIKRPLLMTHGMDDENSGTFPIQSERLYAAIKGHGGIVRLVLLPKEFHGYRSREGVLHTFWEQDQWLENYVKNRKDTQ